jgi:hypothetical protein
MRDEPERVDYEERSARGEVLGGGVWRRLCAGTGRDPKDPALDRERRGLVESVRQAFVQMEGGGFEGLDEWLRLEEEFGGPL